MSTQTSFIRKWVQRIKRNITPVYYEVVYLLATPKHVNTMNFGYAPITDALRANYPSQDQGLQYELYWQVFKQLKTPLSANQIVCEVSSGRGGGLAFLKKLSDAKFIGLDVSPAARRYAKNHFGLDTQAATAPSLPLDDNSIDVFLSVEAAHNYHSAAFIAEIYRCLKPGGVLLLTDMHLGSDKIVREKLFPLYADNGLSLDDWRDIRPHIIASLEQDNERKSVFMRYMLGPLKAEAEAHMGMVGSHKYNEMKQDERSYFILSASKPA